MALQGLTQLALGGLFVIALLPVLWYIPPEHSRRPFRPSIPSAIPSEHSVGHSVRAFHPSDLIEHSIEHAIQASSSTRL